jgi:hypothetical protein
MTAWRPYFRLSRCTALGGVNFCPQEVPENFLALAASDCQQFCEKVNGGEFPSKFKNITVPSAATLAVAKLLPQRQEMAQRVVSTPARMLLVP